jgi:hypothetical protein
MLLMLFLGEYKGKTIPDSPSIYIVPSSLVYQTVTELRRYLHIEEFAILPYFDLGVERTYFWKRAWFHVDLAVYRASRRIIVTSCKVNLYCNPLQPANVT